jgi:hypothetical protein
MSRDNVPDWRELCAAASIETDPEKLASLVTQIIDSLDEESVPVVFPVASERLPPAA